MIPVVNCQKDLKTQVESLQQKLAKKGKIFLSLTIICFFLYLGVIIFGVHVAVD
jgi:hypothetical protein